MCTSIRISIGDLGGISGVMHSSRVDEISSVWIFFQQKFEQGTGGHYRFRSDQYFCFLFPICVALISEEVVFSGTHDAGILIFLIFRPILLFANIYVCVVLASITNNLVIGDSHFRLAARL